MLVRWLACDYSALRPHADRGAVACFWTCWRFSVNLRQLREINICPESVFDSGQVSVVTIRRELHAMSQTLFQIMHEVIGRVCMAATNEPTRHKLCFRVYGYP